MRGDDHYLFIFKEPEKEINTVDNVFFAGSTLFFDSPFAGLYNPNPAVKDFPA